MEIQRRRWKVAAVLVGLACLAAIMLFRQPGPRNIPAIAALVRENGTCGSEPCWRREAYTISATESELVQFYTQQGYNCEERTDRFYESIFFPELQVPFWTCERPREANHSVDIAFQQNASEGMIIHVYVFSRPEW